MILIIQYFQNLNYNIYTFIINNFIYTEFVYFREMFTII